MNYGKEEETLSVEVPASETFELWDPFTGAISKVEAVEKEAGTVEISLKIAPNRGIILVS